MTECENKEVALSSENVLVVISHTQKKIFTWIGLHSAPQSKFACARETARIRMELGYKIINLEESDTSSDFLEAVDEACNITSGKKTVSKLPIKKTKPKPVKPVPKPKPKAKAKKETKPVAREKPEEKRRYIAKAVETTLLDVEHILKQLEVLNPIKGKIRDYVVVGDTLYIAPENLEKSNTESKVSLPDGSFVAEDYISRLFLENGKIIAIELWRDS